MDNSKRTLILRLCRPPYLYLFKWFFFVVRLIIQETQKASTMTEWRRWLMRWKEAPGNQLNSSWIMVLCLQLIHCFQEIIIKLIISLMYILNFEPVTKWTGFFFHNSATTRDGWRLFIWGWYWWQQSPSSGCEQWCTCGKHAPFRPLSCREVDWFKRSSLCSKIPQSEILGF